MHRPTTRGCRRTIHAVAAAAVVLGSLVACSSDDDGAQRALNAFVQGWSAGKLDAVAFINPTGEQIAAADVSKAMATLAGDLAKVSPTVKSAGKPTITKNVANARISVDWPLAGGRQHWTYQTAVRLSKGDKSWRVIWEPTVVHEKLQAGDSLDVRRVTPPRASILDRAGQPIVQPRPVVSIGVQPNQVTNVDALVKTLDAAFRSVPVPVDVSGLKQQLAAASPTAFVAVATIRTPQYAKIRARIHDLPGVKFLEGTRSLAPTRAFARALLGRVDDVQADDMKAHPGWYAIGDQVGHGGLQGLYESRLRGEPGLRVEISRKTSDGQDDSSGTGSGQNADADLFHTDVQPGQPVKTTLDQAVQNAADAALSAERTHRSALVAVRISDGSVLAAANGPDGGDQNLAFTAQVPPGSTFKTVTALGALDTGYTADTVVDCPKTYAAGGRQFTNSEHFALGKVPLRRDFARSCNTAFASLAPRLGPDGLAKTGAELGLGAAWDMGIEAFGGKVSQGGSDAEQAAAAFGQGTNLVSPIAMAGAVAAVARGRWKQPQVLTDPVPAHPAADGPALKPASVQGLKTMMRQVITDRDATAHALADAPGGPVYGKTGTAEFDDNAEYTHGWFVGWQGDVAFAVFVEQGGVSTKSAVPLAERFLRALAAR